MFKLNQSIVIVGDFVIFSSIERHYVYSTLWKRQRLSKSKQKTLHKKYFALSLITIDDFLTNETECSIVVQILTTLIFLVY